MRSRPSTLVAIGAFLLWAALEATGLVFLGLTHAISCGDTCGPVVESIRDALVTAVFALVGLLIALRRPGNAIGWLFLGVALSLAITLLAERYALYAVIAHPGSLPGGIVVAALSQTLWIFLISSLALLLILFPHGRPPSSRWYLAIAVLGLGAIAGWIGGTTVPGPLPAPYGLHDNPLGFAALAPVDGVLFAFMWLFVPVNLAAGASLVHRFRSSTGVERQQYKWFAFAALLLPFVLIITQVASGVGGVTAGVIVGSFAAFVAVVFPIATAVAILKYRLYEIDRLISRALVYVSLTVVLGAAYVGLVLAGQAVFSSFAGGSNLAIAVSTLVVAALFLPVRSQVQAFVDRRFFRSRYDAQRTLETLKTELTMVVQRAMQPTHVSLWHRTGGMGQ